MRAWTVAVCVALGACGGGGTSNPPTDAAADRSAADTGATLDTFAPQDTTPRDAGAHDGDHGDAATGDTARSDGATDTARTDGPAPGDVAGDGPLGDAAPGDVAPRPRTLQTIHGCAPDGRDVVDLTGMADAEITSGPEYIYTPRCARVRVGQTVTFRTDPSTSWNVHPLIAGRIVDDLEVEDPTSPIPLTETGTAPVRVTFREAGSYGYYCTRHWLSGHVGALHVVP